jgi:hypothetical protein
MSAPEVQVNLVEAPEFTVELVGSLVIYPSSGGADLPPGGTPNQLLTVEQQTPRSLHWTNPDVSINDLVPIFEQNLI